MEGWKSAVKEVALAAVAGAVFYLLAAAVFAALVKAYAPPESVVTATNWVLKGVGSLLFPLLFIHKGKALLKGAAAGAVGCIVSMLLFAAIGGGFHLTVFFPLELLFCAAIAAVGALCGVKLRKEG